MTPDQVRERVAAIAAAAGDAEHAHTLEDTLYIDVLNAIADGAYAPRKLAAEALKAADIRFPRYTA